MNILVAFLRDHPAAVDLLATSETVSVEQFADVVEGGGFEFPFPLTDDARRFLADGYLPVIESSVWFAIVQAAEPAGESHAEDDPFDATMNEWVTFAEGQSSTRGNSLPNDDRRTEYRVSLFARLRAGFNVSASSTWTEPDRLRRA